MFIYGDREADNNRRSNPGNYVEWGAICRVAGELLLQVRVVARLMV